MNRSKKLYILLGILAVACIATFAVMQMEERKKRRPVPLAEPVYKVIPPVLVRRETTD